MDYSTFNWDDADYKYEDYYSALGIEDAPYVISGEESRDEIISKATLKPVEKIDEIKDSLDDCLRRFADSIIRQKEQR